MALCVAIASDTAPEAIEVEEHSDHEKQNSDEDMDDDKKTVTVDVDADVGEPGESGEVHDLDKENEMNGGNVEKRSNGVVASAGDGCVAKRQRTGMKAEDVEAVGGEDAEAVGGADAEAVGGADAEAVADPVAVAGDGPKRPISEEDEQSVMTGDAKRSRTEKDDMGAPNGSARPVARVLFGPTTIASELVQAQTRYDDELSSLLKDEKFEAAHELKLKFVLEKQKILEKQQNLSAQDDACELEKMLASMKAQHKAEIDKAVEAEDYSRAQELKVKFTGEQERVQAQIRLKATTLQTTTRDHATLTSKYKAELETKYNDEVQKAVGAGDYKNAAALKEKFMADEAMVQKYEAEINKLVEANNIEGAAAKHKELESKLCAAQQDAESETRKSKYDAELQEALSRQDFKAAAALQQEFNSKTTAAAQVPSAQAPVRDTTSPARGHLTSLADWFSQDGPRPSEIKLQGVRVLSMSKTTAVMGALYKQGVKGNSKSTGIGAKGKGKGKFTGKGKDAKGKSKAARQDSKVLYVGQGTCVIGIAFFGDQLEHLRDIAISSLVDITGLKIRLGQINMFYCGEATVVSHHHSTAPDAFAYENMSLDDLATMSYINECNVGIFVDLVIHTTQVEARLSNEQTADEQPFLLVHGYDMESVPTGSLRFWRYEDGDIAEGKTYIVRGLKIVDDKWWCDGAGYVPRGDGSKTVEICWRTAVEDVTHVQQFSRNFHW